MNEDNECDCEDCVGPSHECDGCGELYCQCDSYDECPGCGDEPGHCKCDTDEGFNYNP